MAHDPESTTFARARAAFADHQIQERQSRSFDFRRLDGSSTYAFSLTWTPGSLALAGDVGELTLVHYGALKLLGPGLAWATSSDHGYLLSKSDRSRVFDRDGSIQMLLDFAKGEDGRKVRTALCEALQIPDTVRGAAFLAMAKRDLARMFEEFGQERAGAFIYELGVFDDWYGTTCWDARTLYQIEAIRHGAKLALAQLAASDEAA